MVRWLVFRSGLWSLLPCGRTICIRSRSQVCGASSFAVASLACTWSDWCLTAERCPPGRADHSLLNIDIEILLQILNTGLGHFISRIAATDGWALFSVRVEEQLVCGRECCQLTSWRWSLVSGSGDGLIHASVVKSWAHTKLEGWSSLLAWCSLACIIHIHLVLRSQLQGSLGRMPLVTRVDYVSSIDECSTFIWARLTLHGSLRARLWIILLISPQIGCICFALPVLAGEQIVLLPLGSLADRPCWFLAILVQAFLGYLFASLIA